MDDISKKIKELRLKNEWTLKNLSEKTELSVSFLSQVERGSSSLTITSLKKIADAFGVKISYFFEEYDENHNYVIKSEDQKPFKIEGSEPTYVRLNGEFSERTLEPLLVTLPPNHKQSQTFGHPGEEFYYVLKGAALFNINKTEYFVREGDSIHFPSHVPHYLENPLNDESTLLCALTPAIF